MIGPVDKADLGGRGWYVTMTYLLTGKTKVPGQPVVPHHWAWPVGPERGWGTWELAARLAQLDFRPRDLIGNRLNALSHFCVTLMAAEIKTSSVSALHGGPGKG